MSNSWFQFKQFTIHQDRTVMKVTTDGCLFGSYCAKSISDIEKNNQQRLLDIGAGTGLLSLMVAQQFNGKIDALEIDRQAAQQARENVEASNWSDRINVIEADALTYIAEKKYDFIVSNPPFYENELSSPDTRKNIAHHNAGLEFSKLLPLIRLWLKPDGHFFLLLPFKRLDEVCGMIAQQQLSLTEKITFRQTAAHAPFRMMLVGRHADQPAGIVVEKEIIIRQADNQYTEAFIDLLKDYYLAL